MRPPSSTQQLRRKRVEKFAQDAQDVQQCDELTIPRRGSISGCMVDMSRRMRAQQAGTPGALAASLRNMTSSLAAMAANLAACEHTLHSASVHTFSTSCRRDLLTLWCDEATSTFSTLRSARLSSGALSSTMLPEVFEHSSLRLSDIKRPTGTVGEGILVRLFPVSRKRMRLISDSKRTLWIVCSPNASSGFLSEWEDAQKPRAKITLSTKAGSLYECRANAKVTNGKAKGQRPLVKGKRKPLMSDERENGDGTETDDPSDEEEEVAENDNDEEVEERGDGEEAEHEEEEEEGEAEHKEAEDKEVEAEEEDREKEGGTENNNAAKDIMIERNAVEDFEKEHDAEEQGDDRNHGEQEEAQAKEADKRKDSGDQGEQDSEKDAQDGEEREKEAEREQEAGEAGGMVDKPSQTREKDDADKGEQAGRNEDDEEAGEEMGTHDEMREEIEPMEQRVTANDCDGA